MASIKLSIAFVLVAIVSRSAASPAPIETPSFWKGTFLYENVEEMRAMCNDDDALACIKFKAMNFLDNLFKKDQYQITEDIEVTKNSYRANEINARSESSLEDRFENYIQGHDVTLKLPFVDSAVTLGARNLDQNEIDLKVKFGSNQVEARKSKLKKILIPIIVLVLLKAITLIPLALGILGLKAWNALQLSFFSFVVSMSLAVFQLCKKIATDTAHPQISAHTPWDVSGGHYAAARSGDDGVIAAGGQQMAYAAYVQ